MTAIAYFIVEGASPDLERVAKQCWSGGFVGVQVIGGRTVLALGWYSGGLAQLDELARTAAALLRTSGCPQIVYLRGHDGTTSWPPAPSSPKVSPAALTDPALEPIIYEAPIPAISVVP